ncbi:MAG TPA: hypothetical protein VIG48_02160 [Jatrophihabitans sp.]|jgi:hypothetical protein
MSDGYNDAGPGEGYGPSPATRARHELYGRPALAAVAVEVAVVVVFGNQWMLDHVIVPWNSSADIAKRSVSDALGAVSWTLTPHGYPWLWLGSIVRALVWFGLTYLLVRRLLALRDAVGRTVAVIGAVFLAQLGALIADRLVGYPNVSKLYGGLGAMNSPPSFGDWMLSGAVGTGGVLLFALLGLVVAGAVTSAVSGSGTLGATREPDGR